MCARVPRQRIPARNCSRIQVPSQLGRGARAHSVLDQTDKLHFRVPFIFPKNWQVIKRNYKTPLGTRTDLEREGIMPGDTYYEAQRDVLHEFGTHFGWRLRLIPYTAYWTFKFGLSCWIHVLW